MHAWCVRRWHAWELALPACPARLSACRTLKHPGSAAPCRRLQAGAALYATRFPERLKPGAFDLTFNSHQLFHVAVVVAACVHYKAVRVLLAWRDASGGCLPPGLLGAPSPPS